MIIQFIRFNLIPCCMKPPIRPSTTSPHTPARAARSTSLIPATAVRPFTVATTPSMAMSAFDRKSTSRRISFSGNSRLTPYVAIGMATNTAAAADHATSWNDVPGRANISDTSRLNKTGKMSTPGNHRRIRYIHSVSGFTSTVVWICADRTQNAICIATSNVRITATSSISAESESQPAICDLDCSTA